MSGAPRSDRAEKIITTAARLFRERGFHSTTIDDIGRAEGIDGSALYRHFTGKDDLLAAVAMRGVRHVSERFDAVDLKFNDADERLAGLLAASGRALIDDLDAIMVSLRDSRYLSAENLSLVSRGAMANNDRLESAVLALRPELAPAQVAFLQQSIIGMLLSIAQFTPAIPAGRLVEIWTVMGRAALLHTPMASIDIVPPDSDEGQPRRRASRRETILSKSTALFRHRGYGGVGIDDIGVAAGIAGPSVYRHFRSKDDLLLAIMSRASEQLAASVAAALAAPTPDAALDRLITSYVQLGVEHADTIAVYFNEVESLSEAARPAVRRVQRRYVDEWQMLISELSLRHSAEDARAASYAAIGLINGYAEGRIHIEWGSAQLILHSIAKAAVAAFVAEQPPKSSEG